MGISAFDSGSFHQFLLFVELHAWLLCEVLRNSNRSPAAAFKFSFSPPPMPLGLLFPNVGDGDGEGDGKSDGDTAFSPSVDPIVCTLLFVEAAALHPAEEEM